jgi:putative restriction endonuclease
MVPPDLKREVTEGLSVYRGGGSPSLNKPLLLLAVLDLAASSHLEENRVRFEPPLFEIYQSYWDAVVGEGRSRIEFPFWYLSSAPFWNPVARSAFADEVAERDAARKPLSANQIRQWIDHVRLSEPFYAVTQDPGDRETLRRIIVDFWLDDDASQTQADRVREQEQAVYRYALALQQAAEQNAPYTATREVNEQIRHKAFRRLVLGAYGYRCAVTGTRLTLPSDRSDLHLVQAAHIHDWAMSHDDSPRNGLPLTPDVHWLFDNGLFTLDRDLCVYPNTEALGRCEGNTSMVYDLRGQRICEPLSPSFAPGESYLRMHWEKHEFSALLN